MFRWGIILALAVLALDQLTKAMIVANIAESTAGSLDIREITPFFNIWHVRNSGMAFSLGNFNDGGRYFIGILAFVVAGVLVFLGSKTPKRIVIAAYALIAGGAVGNAFDRLNPGRQTVVDFLDFHVGTTHWPSFNVADSAIVLGVALILIDMMFFTEKRATGSSE
ncbi:MAG: signal peptidase II [Geminicoccus sp.]|jgi:signal peptidase II|nr:signal peptidase II [Geminicoccus sp.]